MPEIVGEQTIAALDNEVLLIIKECHEKARQMLSENKKALEEISMYLYEKENISGEEFMEIFRKYKNEDTDKESGEAAVEDNISE